MTLTRFKMYLYVQALLLLLFILYQGVWMISGITEGTIVNFAGVFSDKNKTTFGEAGPMVVRYTVNNRVYEEGFERNDIPMATRTVPVRYLLFAPQIAHLNTFIDQWLESIVLLAILSLVTALLFLMQNSVFPKGTLFEVIRRYPYILAHEFYPHQEETKSYQQKYRKQGGKRNEPPSPGLLQ